MVKTKKLLWMFLASCMIGFSACSNADDEPDGGGGQPGGGTGTGTEANPYTVGQIIAKNPTSKDNPVEKEIWVKGYIVGCVQQDTAADGRTTNVNKFEAPFKTNLNVFLSDTKDEKDVKKMINVQLPPGLRDKINLMQHPENLGKVMFAKGDILLYNSYPGIKNVTAEYLEGQQGGSIEVCGGDEANAKASYSIDFTQTSLNKNDEYAEVGWRNERLTGTTSWGVGEFDTQKYVRASTYIANAGLEQNFWLISPALNLNTAASKTVSFKSALAYKGQATCEVSVMQCVDGKTVITKLPYVVPTVPSGASVSPIETTNLDLSQFNGVVYIGFHYIAAGGGNKPDVAPEWRLYDFSFGTAPSTATTVNITSKAGTRVLSGEAYSYTIVTAIENLKGSTDFTAAGNPAWLTMKKTDERTAVLSGTAPAIPADESYDITLTVTNNGVSATESFTLVVKAPVVAGANMVENPDFETWADGIPTGWTLSSKEYAQETKLIHGAASAIKLMPSTARVDLKQLISGIKPGTKYKLEFSYYLEQAAASKTKGLRLWSNFVAADGTTKIYLAGTSDKADGDPMRTNNGYVTGELGAWSQYTIEFTAPEGADKLNFEIRSMTGAINYVDDCILEEIK